MWEIQSKGPGEIVTNSSNLKRRILVVEDDECLKTILARVIKGVDAHIEMDWITSAEEALQRVLWKQRYPEEGYDLILADIVLDGKLSGLDLWDVCRKEKMAVPFLMISGMPADAFLRAVGNRTDHPPYLQKPFSVAQCKKMIDEAVRSSRRS